LVYYPTAWLPKPKVLFNDLSTLGWVILVEAAPGVGSGWYTAPLYNAIASHGYRGRLVHTLFSHLGKTSFKLVWQKMLEIQSPNL
jgi:hypothetical protein